MRLPAAALGAAFAALVLVGAALSGAGAAESPNALPPREPAHTLQEPVDQHDDSRVEVQLVVAGIAAFVVVGVGLAGYAVRRKLGRVTPPSEGEATDHH